MHWASLITFVTCHLRHLLQFYTMMLHPQNIFFILHRWRTGDPLSLSLVLPPALFWDFYPPSGTQCLTLLLPRRRRQWWVLVLFPKEVILSQHMASITSQPFSPRDSCHWSAKDLWADGKQMLLQMQPIHRVQRDWKLGCFKMFFWHTQKLYCHARKVKWRKHLTVIITLDTQLSLIT